MQSLSCALVLSMTRFLCAKSLLNMGPFRDYYSLSKVSAAAHGFCAALGSMTRFLCAKSLLHMGPFHD